MKRLLAVLVLVALVGSSGCTLITTAVKDTTEGRSWRELLFPSWEEMKQQISDAAEKGRQRGQDPEFQRKVGCEAMWTLAILGGLGGAPNSLNIVSSECLLNISPEGLSGALDVPQDPRPTEGPGGR